MQTLLTSSHWNKLRYEIWKHIGISSNKIFWLFSVKVRSLYTTRSMWWLISPNPAENILKCQKFTWQQKSWSCKNDEQFYQSKNNHSFWKLRISDSSKERETPTRAGDVLRSTEASCPSLALNVPVSWKCKVSTEKVKHRHLNKNKTTWPYKWFIYWI